MTVREVCRNAARRVWRRPHISIAVFLTLGLGIGLATSVFAILNAVLLRPLPIVDPARVVWIQTLTNGEADGSSPGLLFAWRDRSQSVLPIAAIREANATIDDEHGIDRLRGAFVTAEYFDVLGARAARGRVFGPELDRPGRDPVVVLSHRLWQQRYSSDESVVGRTVTFNGGSRTIIGVLPEAFDELREDQAWWAPLALPESQRANLGTTYLDVVGRLAPNTSAEAARVELATIARAVGATASDGSARGIAVTAFGTHLTAAHRPTLMLLFGAVIVLLAIACANVANLLLADGVDRQNEIAVRSSLGATRAQLLGQMLLEGFLVALCASAFGVVLAQWLIGALVATLPAEMPRLALTDIGGPAALFAVALAVGSTLAGAVLPAVRSSRIDAGDVLRARASVSGPASIRLRQAFVVGQVALTTGLASSGALLLQSTRALEGAPRGYEPSVLTSTLVLPPYAYPTSAAQSAAFDILLRSVDTMPGVTRAAIATRVPLAGAGAGSDVVRVDEDFNSGSDRQVRIRLVSPGFFATMGVPVVQGREFEAGDRHESRRVVVVNETLARRLNKGDRLTGTAVKFALREFSEDGRVSPWEVVGVVADTFDQGPRAAVAPEIFVPVAQAPSAVLGWMGHQVLLAVQSAGGASLTAADLQAAVARAGLKIPLYDVRTIDERLAAHLARERTVSRVFTMLAVGGLSLSGLGIFAVVHHLVRRRRREMALRLALGANPATLTGSVVREALAMTVAGLFLGVIVFQMVAGAIRPLLFGVGSGDPLTFGVVAVILAAVAVGAASGPARSVATLDPASVLRED